MENKERIQLLGLWQWTAILFLVILVAYQFFDVNAKIAPWLGVSSISQRQNDVLPEEGVILPARWGNIGKQMVNAGVIDAQKFEALYTNRGGLDESAKKMLYGEDNGNIIINEQNSGFVLNMLWAFGLSNKNDVLERGPMTDEKYGGAGKFASTSGWRLAKGETMTYYSKYSFATLTHEQQALVEKVSKNIYRPCCGNSTYFPDCNHGMAMLGLLELMASQGAMEDEMYKVALQVNSYWFPDTYLTIAKYFEKRGVAWSEVDPKEALGAAYSSASGYRDILSDVNPEKGQNSGGGCSA